MGNGEGEQSISHPPCRKHAASQVVKHVAPSKETIQDKWTWFEKSTLEEVKLRGFEQNVISKLCSSEPAKFTELCGCKDSG